MSAVSAVSAVRSSTRTRARPVGSDAVVPAVVTAHTGRVSWHIRATRRAGYSSSTGRKTAPAFHTATIATTNSAERGSATATVRSGPAPRVTRTRASRSARASSSAYDRCLVPALDRHRVRHPRHLRGEQVERRGARRQVAAGPGQGLVVRPRAPLVEDEAPLARRQQLRRRHRALRIRDERAQQALEPAGDAVGGVAVEQVDGVGEFAGDAVGAAVRVEGLVEADGQVELDRFQFRGLAGEGEAGEFEAGRAGVLEGQHHLEQRVPGRERTGFRTSTSRSNGTSWWA